MRMAAKPWGPWSRRRVLLNWIADGLGYRRGPDGTRLRSGWFIHDNQPPPADDLLGDDIPRGDVPAGTGGAVYAPYQLPDLTRREGTHCWLHYLISTWNPYQVVQMEHRISDAEFEALERD
jgi:hypothetical protein